MTRTYTEDQVLKEKNKSFIDGQLHASPSRETDVRLNALESSISQIADTLKKFDSVPTTLALIQQDLKDNNQLKKDVSSLKAWRTGLAMVLGSAMFLFGYFVNIMQSNLELKMEKTAQNIVDKELSKYNISYEQN